MMRNVRKKFNKTLFKKNTLILLLSIQNSLAYTTNNNISTQVQIYSNYQNVNMITNTLTASGNVVIQTNFMNMYADKIHVTYSKKNNQENIIDVYGNPVIYYHFKHNENQMLATSLHMSYKTHDNILTLQGKVYLKNKNYTLQSNCIKYFIKNKYIETCNNQCYFHKTILTATTNNHNKNIKKHSLSP